MREEGVGEGARAGSCYVLSRAADTHHRANAHTHVSTEPPNRMSQTTSANVSTAGKWAADVSPLLPPSPPPPLPPHFASSSTNTITATTTTTITTAINATAVRDLGRYLVAVLAETVQQIWGWEFKSSFHDWVCMCPIKVRIGSRN